MANKPFVVNVGALRKKLGDQSYHVLKGYIPDLVVNDSLIKSDSEITTEVDLYSISGAIQAKGHILAPWQGECRRCLQEVNGIIDAHVDELFTYEGDPEENYLLTGDDLDLEPLTRDTLLLELPLAPLCRENCLGLCPECGVNWNDESCNCQLDLRDPRWAGLDDLRDS